MSWYYFAARYSRNPELRGYRDELVAAIPGAAVTSRWLDCHNGQVQQSYEPVVLNADPAAVWQYGHDDLADLRAADTLVTFTSVGGKGGRHVEHGYAMGLNKRIVIVGAREHIFHCSPDAEVYPTWQAFLAAETEAARS